MKTSYLTLVAFLILAACGNKKTQTIDEVIATKNLEAIRAKRAALDAEKQTIDSQIKLLNDAIEELDTLKENPLVTVIDIKKQEYKHYLELQGDVKTKQNVLVYPEMPGQIQKIFVKVGQSVNKGQTLAKLDDGGLAQQVAQLEATVALSKTTFERQAKLWEQKIGSEIQYLQAKTNYEASQKQLEQLKIQLAKSVIKAPFTGVVDDVIKEEGVIVAPGPGSELFRIVNLGDMYIEADVPETYIATITKNKEVTIDFPILGKSLQTKVRQTGNFINPANRTFKIEIGIPNTDKDIKPNLTAKLKINDYLNPTAILVPQSIISENAEGDQYVYVIKNLDDNLGTAVQTIVTTGKTQGDFIEILSGINEGDLVIEAGARSVKNNQKVEISK